MNNTNSVLKNKTALIVGGSSGIGLEIAKGFAHAGAKTVIAGRNKDKLRSALKLLKNEGIDNPLSYSLDVTSYPSIQKGLQFVLSKFEKLDIVVCTAGIHLKIPAREMKPDQWKKIMDINLTGTYYVDSIFGEQMIQQKKGSLINIASLGSRVALSSTSAYNVSKSGVEMLTKCLAVEWAEYGVRVNAILPGVFKTPLNEKALSDKKRVKNILNHTPMKRFGKLHEILSAAIFLASDNSSFVTGTSVIVDGGFLAYAGF
jgi:NAD(P)-dependent dehydrogenase (short-subunit alcohol dehydrogenase family)